VKLIRICATASVLIAIMTPAGNTAEHSHTAGRTVPEGVLWSFGASNDGSFPAAGLLADRRGNLYGTTVEGGTPGPGTVFELSPPFRGQTQWTEQVLWSFGANGDGIQPFGSLIADRWGNLYGTTEEGGAHVGGGTVFELSPPSGTSSQWSERVLWSFGATDDGTGPGAGLLADKWGNLYGATIGGGANGGGTVFELSPPSGISSQWSEQVLWSFGATNDGEFPVAGLIADKWGNLYSTTYRGGANGSDAGTVFELSPPSGTSSQWSERVLWSFGATDDGANPEAGLLADKWGNFYGTTQFGGANSSCNTGVFGCGAAFELSPPHGTSTQWQEAVRWSFGASGDGANPAAGLTADKSGGFFGTTGSGGANDTGTVFELTPPAGRQMQWSERVRWSFGANDDGANPAAGLLADNWGNLYGTTTRGGTNLLCTEPGNPAVGCGTAFELSFH